MALNARDLSAKTSVVTERHRLVHVPASSGNLGAGYDVLAAALSLRLELEVVETGSFDVDADGLPVPLDRSNLCVRAFERLHPADGISFSIRSDIPLAAGLGSSAAAIVAGLIAADHLYELALSPAEILRHAAELEGHPDNVAAALYGGFVICAPGDDGIEAIRFEPPAGLEAIVVVPDEEVPTERAREAIPDEVPLFDAVANIASASLLVLGLARGEMDLVARGLGDRIHQPRRSSLYPRSLELAADVREYGAIGATISGAGPTLLVWSWWEHTGSVVEALRKRVEGWAEVRRVAFDAAGADVPQL